MQVKPKEYSFPKISSNKIGVLLYSFIVLSPFTAIALINKSTGYRYKASHHLKVRTRHREQDQCPRGMAVRGGVRQRK